MPDPGTLSLLGIGSIVNSFVALINGWRGRSQTKKLEEKRLASQERLNQLNLERQTVFHEENLAFQRQHLDEEMKLQRELATYARQSQLLLAQEQRETAIQTVVEKWRLDHWPLKLAPVDILGRYKDSYPYPLKVFLAPAEIQFDSLARPGASLSPLQVVLQRMENSLRTELQKFLQTHYPVKSSSCPVELIDGAWNSKAYSGKASIIVLHKMLQTEPTLILELVHTNTTLHLNIAYWGMSEKTPNSHVLAEIPLHHILQDSARKRVETLKQAQDRLKQEGEYDLAKENKVVETNIKALDQNNRLAIYGIAPLNEYPIVPDDIDHTVQIIVNVLCLVTAWFADAHHLISTATPEKVLPKLPKFLSDYCGTPFMDEILRPLLPDILKTYRQLIEAIKDEQPYYVPLLAFHLAEGLSRLPEKSWADKWMNYAMHTHLENLGIRNVRPSQLLETYLRSVIARNANEIGLLNRSLANLDRHKVISNMGLDLLESDLRTQYLWKDELLNG